MELYIQTWCGYCRKVIEAAKELGVPLVLHDIADSALAAELEARGGKQQVPYLVDTTTGIEMYESDDIIEYLKDQQGEAA
jgi:glutathione S-transferase